MTTREELRGSLRRLVSTFLLGKIGLDLLNVIRMPSTFPPLTDELADEILALHSSGDRWLDGMSKGYGWLAACEEIKAVKTLEEVVK